MELVILGNELFLNSMAERLAEICGENIRVSLKQTGATIYKICVCGGRAVKIFEHLYPIAKAAGALERKWREEYLTEESSNI